MDNQATEFVKQLKPKPIIPHSANSDPSEQWVVYNFWELVQLVYDFLQHILGAVLLAKPVDPFRVVINEFVVNVFCQLGSRRSNLQCLVQSFISTALLREFSVALLISE